MQQTQQTTDYGIFKLRDDNRSKIQRSHVEYLMESIQSKNMLDMSPIHVNANMEVIDGQHRLHAAKELKIPIYYVQRNDLTKEDIILMNVQLKWNMNDYMNFYVKNAYPEYLKLQQFTKVNNVSLKVALALIVAKTRVVTSDFKKGNFVMPEGLDQGILDLCWQSINYIERINGKFPFLKAGKFWSALIKMMGHPDFVADRWFKNLERFVHKIVNKVSEEDYLDVFVSIHNYKNNRKIRTDELDATLARKERAKVAA